MVLRDLGSKNNYKVSIKQSKVNSLAPAFPKRTVEMKFLVLLTSLLEVKKKMKRAEKQNHQKKAWRRLKDDLKLLKSKSKAETSTLRKSPNDQEDWFDVPNDKRENAKECFSWIDITFEENREIENNEWSSTFLSNSSDVGEDIFLEKDFSSSTLTRRFR